MISSWKKCEQHSFNEAGNGTTTKGFRWTVASFPGSAPTQESGNEARWTPVKCIDSIGSGILRLVRKKTKCRHSNPHVSIAGAMHPHLSFARARPSHCLCNGYSLRVLYRGVLWQHPGNKMLCCYHVLVMYYSAAAAEAISFKIGLMVFVITIV